MKWIVCLNVNDKSISRWWNMYLKDKVPNSLNNKSAGRVCWLTCMSWSWRCVRAEYICTTIRVLACRCQLRLFFRIRNVVDGNSSNGGISGDSPKSTAANGGSASYKCSQSPRPSRPSTPDTNSPVTSRFAAWLWRKQNTDPPSDSQSTESHPGWLLPKVMWWRQSLCCCAWQKFSGACYERARD